MSESKLQLVYDKQCPACEFYCQLLRVRESVGDLELVDAREPSPIVDEITARGLDIDQGMVLNMNGVLYYGADAIHMLSLISTRAGIFNRLSFWLFGFKPVAAVLYPVLRTLRNLLLKMLGRSKINNLDVDGNERF